MSLRTLTRFGSQLRQLSTARVFFNKEYTPNEEWLLHKNKLTTIGITKSAVEQLGDVVYIEYLFEKGDFVKKDEELVVIESVKATESIKAPFDNTIVDNNEELEIDLSNLNQDPENTWIIKIEKE